MHKLHLCIFVYKSLPTSLKSSTNQMFFNQHACATGDLYAAIIQNMTVIYENMLQVKTQMETCVQMQLFGVFMLILGLYDVIINMRQNAMAAR